MGYVNISFRRHGAILRSVSRRRGGPSRRLHHKFHICTLDRGRAVCRASRGSVCHPSPSEETLDYIRLGLHHPLLPTFGFSQIVMSLFGGFRSLIIAVFLLLFLRK